MEDLRVLHDQLWQANADLADRCLAHPFVTGLADGSLPRAAFERYVTQDSFYLRVFFRAYALAAGKVERQAHMELLLELMGGALEEMRMHERFAAELGIDLREVRPLTPTRSYTEFLEQMAWQRALDAHIAGMTPCMRLYAHLGSQLASTARAGAEPAYRRWIDTYAAADFQVLADRVDGLLDDVAGDTAEVREAYRFAMRCELDFFEAAYRGE
jgi:thiaminase/transcriptional activator TenA